MAPQICENDKQNVAPQMLEEETWNTWIDYPKFHQLVQVRYEINEMVVDCEMVDCEMR